MVDDNHKCLTLLNFEEVITRFSNHHWRMLLSLVVVITLALSLWSFNPSLATWGDNAEFVVLSKSISQGEGFKLINFPNPKPNKRYPPGFPLLLVPMIWLFGTNIVLLKISILIIYIISIIGIFLILRQLIRTWIALFITLVISSNFILLNFSCQLMAEIPYLCFSVLSLCFYLSYKKAAPVKIKKVLFLCFTLCSLYCFYIKVIGIALIGAIWLSLLLEKKYKDAVSYIGLVIVLYLPWLVRDQMVGSNTYIKQFLLVNPYNPSQGSLDWLHFIMRVKLNFLRYFQYNLPFILWPSIIIEKMERIAHIFFFLNIVFFLLFFMMEWLRKRYVVVIYVVFSLLILLAWPPIWAVPRMLIQLVPFIFVIYGVIINQALTILKNKRVVGICTVIFSIVSLFYSTLHWQYAKELEYGFKSPSFINYYKLCSWVRVHIEDDAIINARKPYLAFLLSGKKTTNYSDENPERFYELLKKHRVTHIIVSNLQLPGQKDYFKLLKRKKDKFLFLHKTNKPNHYLYRVLN